MRHDDAVAGEQNADLGNGEVLLDPGFDPGVFIEQDMPRVTVIVGPVRSHSFDQLTNQLVGQLRFITRPVESEVLGALEVAPHRLSIDAHSLGDCSFSRAP